MIAWPGEPAVWRTDSLRTCSKLFRVQEFKEKRTEETILLCGLMIRWPGEQETFVRSVVAATSFVHFNQDNSKESGLFQSTI